MYPACVRACVYVCTCICVGVCVCVRAHGGMYKMFNICF